MNELKNGAYVLWGDFRYKVIKYRLRSSQCGLRSEDGVELYPLNTQFVRGLEIAPRRKRATKRDM